MDAAARVAVSGLAGLVFGMGLILAGMTDPSVILAFLDLAGAWNPSLALVMAGAIAVGMPAFALAARRTRSLLDEPMRLPSTTALDGPLVVGSFIFGIGWGLAGYCPGPAVASLFAGSAKPAVFVLAMLAGMAGYEIVRALAPPRRP